MPNPCQVHHSHSVNIVRDDGSDDDRNETAVSV